MFADGSRLAFEPLIPEPLLLGLIAVSVLVVLLALLRGARGGVLRLCLMAVLLAYLAGPTMVTEERRYHDDVAVVVVDRSISQETGDRTAQTDRALAALKADLAKPGHLELRVVEAGPRAGGPPDGTMLVEAARRALEGVPKDRRAGVVMITDGQVHDLPQKGGDDLFGAPLHVLLTGERQERDRRIEVVSAPAFAIVGQEARAALIVHDRGASSKFASVAVRRDGEPLETRLVPIGERVEIPLPVAHGGRNVFELVVKPGEDELTLENNRAAISLNGVRDRLRVLLVSGEPYNGERTWRNLLKADPAVDLVHFTILRPPQKQDATPIHELALIAFPIRELFEVKINDFDLIIFDRFWRRGVLQYNYLNNIARYVEEGGALLNAAGPAFAGPASIYRTPLADVLPSAPTGEVTVRGFRPKVSDIGSRHPVTAELRGPQGGRDWGRWFRLIDTRTDSADVLMTGPGDKPLLVLDRVGKGRVAQLLSDQAWLWARGYEGGGPQAEILRRVAHWLMKEPALEEESVTAEIDGRRLSVRRRSLTPGPRTVTVTAPDGRVRTLDLQPGEEGQSSAQMDLDVAGLYRVSDGDLSSVAVLGHLNPLEFADLISTPAKLAPFAEASGGGVIRLEDDPEPEARRVRPGGRTAGRGWFGLVENEAYDVTGLSRSPAAPPWAVVLLLLALALMAWRRESR